MPMSRHHVTIASVTMRFTVAYIGNDVVISTGDGEQHKDIVGC